MNPDNVEFSEEESANVVADSALSKFDASGPRGLVGFLIKSGIVRRSSGANVILVIFSILCVALAVWLFVSFYL